jgi:hypothetical protein
MNLQLSCNRAASFLSGAALLCLFCPSLKAQPAKTTPAPVKAAPVPASAGFTQERLVPEKDWGSREASEELKQFEKLRRGEQPITEADRALLDRGAQWFAYRLTHSEFQEGKPGSKTLHHITKDALDQIIDPKATRPTPNMLQFKEEFDKRFVTRLQEVTKNRRLAARVNAAIILAKLAERGSEESADVLVEIIKNPAENDGVKLWALRGLGRLFMLGHGENGTPFKNKEREARSIAALTEYVTSTPKLPEGAPREEVAAATYVRARAIAALGQTRYPGVLVPIDKKTRRIDRTTALVLLKLMRADAQPKEPTLEEQVAAATGICRLQARLLEQYNPDYAAYQIGRFIADFCQKYRDADHNSTNKRQAPWKSMALQLSQGLKELQNEGGNRESAPYIEKMCKLADPILQDIIIGPPKASPDQAALVSWLEQNLPKHGTLYQGVPSSVVGTPDKTAE